MREVKDNEKWINDNEESKWEWGGINDNKGSKWEWQWINENEGKMIMRVSKW